MKRLIYFSMAAVFMICKIQCKILNDVAKVVFDTYEAKYGEPTSGSIEDEYDDSYAYAEWKFINQKIHLCRTAEQKIDFNARPICKYYAFSGIDIYYEDSELYRHFCSVNAIQIKYDNTMKPIRDSIEAARKQAIEDSLNAVRRNELLKKASQI